MYKYDCIYIENRTGYEAQVYLNKDLDIKNMSGCYCPKIEDVLKLEVNKDSIMQEMNFIFIDNKNNLIIIEGELNEHSELYEDVDGNNAEYKQWINSL